MAVQVYSGFGYWNGLSWSLSFLLALLIVLAVTGLGRRDFRSSASSGGSEKAFSQSTMFPPLSLPRSFTERIDFSGGLEERRCTDLVPDQAGVLVLFMALLLIAVLLGGGLR